jgi:hypothetical protein
MPHFVIPGLLILIVAVVMTMVGKGGGNFYVVILTLSGTPMHEAATTGQFILFAASVTAMIIFQKNKSVSWPLVVLIGSLTAVAALAGGYVSHFFEGFSLKILFAVMLLGAGIIMLIPTSNNQQLLGERQRFGIIVVKAGKHTVGINVWVALPVTIATGFASGMVGVSGGSFLVPLMAVACNVPMHTAVGTASILIAATSAMGFTGHALQGDFNPSLALPLALVTVIGGLFGSRFALQSKPKRLKMIFAVTNWAAALFMAVNALRTINVL